METLISELDFLEQMPPRSGTNPFTKEQIVASNANAAYVTRNGKRIGSATLKEGEILLSGAPKGLCEEIAARLSARMFESDNS